ncbi:hypothetical protein DSO57_1015199 [Entomophthora muscae]|uniref:Uncharacterized protein n=1 Tax=Entomophthora muscae TaxID=34485 RepID=A0ACC2S7C6_9FUNG|nr:hypothetical protein DSO57_1015199 [Entomophthora muscae]
MKLTFLNLLSIVSSIPDPHQCRAHFTRINILSLTNDRFQVYIDAIKRLSKPKKNKVYWAELAREYRNSSRWRLEEFIEFNRMYLATVEEALQKYSPSLSIPYWTPRENDTKVFSKARFGTMEKNTYSVNGQLEEMEFLPTPKREPLTIKRKNDNIKQVGKLVIQKQFSKKRVMLMLYWHFMDISHVMGGTYQFATAAFDPFFLSHIAYLDARYESWKHMNNKPASKKGPLGYFIKETPDRQFHSSVLRKAYSDLLKKDKCVQYTRK